MNIEIAGLTRRFGRNQAVAGVDLEAGPGVFGLLGPNGAGKTSHAADDGHGAPAVLRAAAAAGP